tara:strand:- start:475 stop:1020 length:546 start_codon:yes stop_codon:yes gene_type:complete
MWIQVATEKQKRFAKLIANGCDKDGKPITAIDAYVEAGYKELKPRNAQGVEACRLIASDTVSNLIEEERVLIKKFEQKVQKKQEILTLSDTQRVLDKLRTWIDGDIEASTSQLRSAELLARVSGMLRTDISIENKERSSSEIEGLLNSKLAALSAIVEDNDELVNTEDEESTIKTYKDSMH